uniref:Uncharacterized protein n=1 Tax=Hyaloperonospora arabidopsidis (strain Emoy2) TaxID=559515 RepID=M4BEH4_HYAAE
MGGTPGGQLGGAATRGRLVGGGTRSTTDCILRRLSYSSPYDGGNPMTKSTRWFS